MKRILSILLIVTVLLLTAAVSLTAADAATQNQQNIVGCADYYYDITWTALKTIDGWHSSSSSYTFTKGNTYRIPYAQPINSGKYIGYGATVETFLAAAKDVNSVFYTSTSSYNNTHSAYYGMDCSAFVSSCWGAKRTTTYYIPTISDSLGSVSESTIDSIALGDAFNSKSVGHVVLVTDIEYDAGKVSKVEITEETPPQLKRTVYTRASLISKYSAYTIQRYTGAVPTPPEGYALAEPTAAPTDPPRLLGDAYCDGEVTILDVTTVQRHLVDIAVSAFDEAAANADCDDDVTIIDATCIQRWLVGIPVPTAIGDPI